VAKPVGAKSRGVNFWSSPCVVPTAFVAPREAFRPPAEPFVVKPSISAGGRSSAQFEPGDRDAAAELVSRIHGEGRPAMVSPFLGEAGETADIVAAVEVMRGEIAAAGEIGSMRSMRISTPIGARASGTTVPETLLPPSAPTVKVVVISGLSDGTEEDAAHAAGATGFLFKGGLYNEIGDAIVDAHLAA